MRFSKDTIRELKIVAIVSIVFLPFLILILNTLNDLPSMNNRDSVSSAVHKTTEIEELREEIYLIKEDIASLKRKSHY